MSVMCKTCQPARINLHNDETPTSGLILVVVVVVVVVLVVVVVVV